MIDEIKFHFFEVGRGDSILVEIVAGETYYVLIDSNQLKRNGRYVNPAYDYLKSRGVNKLVAIIISHFHSDHIFGIEKFLDEFEIQQIYIPPILTRRSKVTDEMYDKIIGEIKRTSKGTNDEEILSEMRSLTKLVKFIKTNQNIVLELEGPENTIRLSNFEDRFAFALLPLAKFKGELFTKVLSDEFCLNTFSTQNDTSIAILMEIFGHKIVLAGDSTKKQWMEHRRQRRKYSNNIKAQFLKVPHHGSKEDNDLDVFEYILTDRFEECHIFISANGKTHPDDVIFDMINNYNLNPHCTNLAHQCVDDNLSLFLAIPGISLEALSFIYNYDVKGKPTQCQGDITLNINKNEYTIDHSTKLKCIYS